MNKKLKIILAFVVGVLPVQVGMIWYRLTQSGSFSLIDMLVYPLVVGGGNIILIILLNRYFLHQRIRDFNSGKGTWYWDILAGVILAGINFLLLFVERPLLSQVLSSGQPPSPELLNMLIGLSRNPVLLAIWLGPVVWIGVALFEEVIRVFFLDCLWKLVPGKAWIFFSILLVSFLTGMAHIYQGTFGLVSIGIQGLLMGGYYYRFRRLLPLVIAHALYDSIQVITFLIQVS